jgi:hypothetical protein
MMMSACELDRSCPAESSVEVRVLNAKALCTCGSSRFHPPFAPPRPVDALFRCAACGRTTSYGALLERIGDAAIEEARSALTRLREGRQDSSKAVLVKLDRA